MQYISTRASGKQEDKRTFLQILLEGLAPDGGLYMPESYPRVTDRELTAWRSFSYAGLAFEILRKFTGDMPDADLERIVMKTYTPEVYRNARPDEDAARITPLRMLKQGDRPLALLGLSGGPTLAFKDMAMQLLGNLFEYELARKQETLNILGATSGDTGSAAEYAMRGKKGIRVFMLSPHQKMSAFQTAQMFSLQDPNIFNIAVEGVFDDCQDMVKAVSGDLLFKSRQKIGTVNSINWARVVAQVVYYFRGYLEATENNTQKVSFTVPSGNFGNICAGHIARMMGLPIARLVVATNENDVLDEFFRTGIYRVRRPAETLHTSSPSMDISKASNFERFIYDLLGRDGQRVRALFSQIDKKGGFDLSGGAGSDGDEFLKVPAFGFLSGRSTHQDRLGTIRSVYRDYGIVIDTHTADGVKVAMEHLEPGIPMVVLETALAAKFSETIQEALGREAVRPAGFDNIERLPQRYVVMPPDAVQIKQYIAGHTGL
ncbi:MAG: threonine synthase [Alistipes senegalensis]|nr:threonine synthase [Oxalobacter formigenes]MCM1281648.1 threonine synthase [Alistipes senegalensis]